MEPRTERKVVTVLFCDLVGFTQRSEEMDPEDVAALLAPYHARVKEELERYGGTVEKFIGDAVMAVFGAPVAHEDDPERAVRAAFAIRSYAEDEGIELRIGIATGEALVTLGARPDQGETMATGDVVNTAARLQAAAPVGGIVVGEKTFGATKHSIDYRELDPVDAKGKARPIPAREALRARARITLDRLHGTPLVGRERELDLLVDALSRARAERQPQLVTLVGVPGIGKSRLVYELSQAVEDDPELIAWRQGRCLPYGEGVTFWALSEIVKAELGVLESDAAERVEERLLAAVSEDWVRGYLRPLVGLDLDGAGMAESRDQAFAAWRRFLEGVAAKRPLVLVFEDLHWADDDLLDFVDHLVDWASGVTLLVVCTARPELLERRPGWGGGKTNALTVTLSPLSDEQTAHLLAGLLQQVLMPADTQAALLARAGGNPLYAEQYVRMLDERTGAELALPETVQGIIAARLDVLADEQKALLQDASVVGKVFWLGALTSISGSDARAVEASLHALERKGFVRRERETSIEGDTEYAFLHVLVRDVAYGQIPRAARSEKHRLAAGWIDGLGRPDDHAEMLAHHYGEALALAQAAGADLSALKEPARGALRDAGDRAMALHAYAAALRFYEQALSVWPEHDPERASLLFRRARAVFFLEIDRTDLLEEARAALVAAGDREAAAEAEVLHALALRIGGRPLDALDRARSAVALLEDAPPSRAKAHGLANLARLLMVSTERHEEAIKTGEVALAMAEDLGLGELAAHSLNSIGMARVLAGDFGGIDELEESLRLALEHGSPFESGRVYNNLAAGYDYAGRVEEGAEAAAANLELATKFGLPSGWQRGMVARFHFSCGRWEEARRLAEELLASGEATVVGEPDIRGLAAELRLADDDVAGAASECERALELVRGQQQDTMALTTLTGALRRRATIALAEGRRAAADEIVDSVLFRSPVLWGEIVIELALLLVDLERSGDALISEASSRPSDPWLEVGAAIARGQLVQAADRLATMGAPTHEAAVRLRAAAELVASGRRAEADGQLQRALRFYRSVGAPRYVREAEALLAATA